MKKAVPFPYETNARNAYEILYISDARLMFAKESVFFVWTINKIFLRIPVYIDVESADLAFAIINYSYEYYNITSL